MATKYEPTGTITWEATQVVLSQAATAALLEFASTDAEHPHLGIGIRDGQLCATDGRTGLRYDAPQCEPTKALTLDGKVWTREYVATRLAIAKAEKSDVKLEMSFFHDAVFPPFSQVVPEEGFGKCAPVAVNPEYLARMVKGCKALANTGCLLVAMHGEFDPLMYRVDGLKGCQLKASIIIMGMRY